MYWEKFYTVLQKQANCQAEVLDAEPTKFSYKHSDHVALFPAIASSSDKPHPKHITNKLHPDYNRRWTCSPLLYMHAFHPIKF